MESKKITRRKKTDDEKKKDYYPLIGDVCGKFSWLAKETFFKNDYYNFLFQICVPLLEMKAEELDKKKKNQNLDYVGSLKDLINCSKKH